MRIKTENVKESLEPVDVDKAGSDRFRSIRRRDTWSEQNVCTAWILYRVFKSRDYKDLSRKNPFDHVSLFDEETRDVKRELDDIDNKFDDARAAKLKFNNIQKCTH